MTKPWAVLISDIHYSLPTLQLADASMRQAIAHANRLHVPLIVAGDLHDTKGALRGECVKAMLDTFRTANVPTYVIPGNHCMINEKSKEHSLEFLRTATRVIDSPANHHGLWLVPYDSDSASLNRTITQLTENSTVIAHCGVQSAYMGHYTQDKSSLPKEAFALHRVISGHYHRRQDIKCGFNTFSYIGNPYTLNFGEALDPPKGFQVLNTDGSLTFVPTNLRKHLVIEMKVGDPLAKHPDYHPGDLVKVKLHGPKSELDKINQRDLGEALIGHSNYKLDLVPTKAEAPKPIESIAPTVAELMDSVIDASGETPEQKDKLKALWRSL